jgi:hypothetical protein
MSPCCRTVVGTGAFLYRRACRCYRPRPRPVTLTATWRSGYAAVCKTVYPGSIPGVASTSFPRHLARSWLPVIWRLEWPRGCAGDAAPTVGLQTAGRAPDAPASQSRGNNRVTSRRARVSHSCSGARWRSMWKGTSFRWACLGYRQCNLCEISFTKCRSRFCCVLLPCCKFELARWGHWPATCEPDYFERP